MSRPHSHPDRWIREEEEEKEKKEEKEEKEEKAGWWVDLIPILIGGFGMDRASLGGRDSDTSLLNRIGRDGATDRKKAAAVILRYPHRHQCSLHTFKLEQPQQGERSKVLVFKSKINPWLPSVLHRQSPSIFVICPLNILLKCNVWNIH